MSRNLWLFLTTLFFFAAPSSGECWTFILPPKNANEVSIAHTNVGLRYYNERQFDKALQHFEKAVIEALDCCEKDKTINAIFYWNIGVFYEKSGQTDKARAYYAYSRQFLNVRQ